MEKGENVRKCMKYVRGIQMIWNMWDGTKKMTIHFEEFEKGCKNMREGIENVRYSIEAVEDMIQKTREMIDRM